MRGGGSGGKTSWPFDVGDKEEKEPSEAERRRNTSASGGQGMLLPFQKLCSVTHACVVSDRKFVY